MNNISVSITPKNTIKYPLHQHSEWEIMYYLSGEGYLATKNENIPFKKGSVIIVPPETTHGSVSKNGFVNISVSGAFNHLFLFEKPIMLYDNSALEGEQLAKLIFKNRSSNANYLSSLCLAYIYFLLQNSEYENNSNRIVAETIAKINECFSDCEFDVTDLLIKSGYAEDYIRAIFKKITSLTPVQFLTKQRIDHAKKLFEIYGDNISVAEVSHSCGFKDPAYFSKRFKQIVGVSPDAFKNKQ